MNLHHKFSLCNLDWNSIKSSAWKSIVSRNISQAKCAAWVFLFSCLLIVSKLNKLAMSFTLVAYWELSYSVSSACMVLFLWSSQTLNRWDCWNWCDCRWFIPWITLHLICENEIADASYFAELSLWTSSTDWLHGTEDKGQLFISESVPVKL